MHLRIKRLDPGLPLPAYAHEGDAGLDLYAAEDVSLARALDLGAGVEGAAAGNLREGRAFNRRNVSFPGDPQAPGQRFPLDNLSLVDPAADPKPPDRAGESGGSWLRQRLDFHRAGPRSRGR